MYSSVFTILINTAYKYANWFNEMEWDGFSQVNAIGAVNCCGGEEEESREGREKTRV